MDRSIVAIKAHIPARETTFTSEELVEEERKKVVGTDFADSLCRRDHDKVYIALFTCAVTRAVHLEVVCSQSMECFRLTFRLFISRRGIRKILNSDNELPFKSAGIELKRLYMNIYECKIILVKGAQNGSTLLSVLHGEAWGY
ncbi:hypothetical protein AVEN_245431-1 [Araneus ventricosus]|uniref:Integrase catalytic domain-containing protein n=1 Tax=Araneus ventricosus TaxID=182803 RepID=A0A4Y2LT08_ARAVE|nr:hypothetical protein AVEN_245431-1 [Araneus ventricosus]